MKAKAKCVSLEDYMDFLENPHTHGLTHAHLNQIIAMHGFGKFHHRPKMFLVNELNSMKLNSPHRSSLKDVISSCASIPGDEVVRDLDLLQWNECSVESIETVNSSVQADLQRSCLVKVEAVITKRRRMSWSRKSVAVKALDELVAAANAVSSYWLRF